MKRILITGKNSYIGTSFEKWIGQYPNDYSVNTIDMKDDSWRDHDFSQYDVVFHVAGIAHVKETKLNIQSFYKVNRDLAIATAQKSKESGISHFIFMSSMSVYGKNTGKIDIDTPTNPNTHYGLSKLQAEFELRKLNCSGFIVSIIRPSMVYGRGCQGNFSKLVRLSRYLPFFPKIYNKRSMIFIENLVECVRVIIDLKKVDTTNLHDPYYVNTSEMYKLIREAFSQKTFLISGLSFLKTVNFKVTSKLFGDLFYDKTSYSFISEYDIDRKYSFTTDISESIRKSI